MFARLFCSFVAKYTSEMENVAKTYKAHNISLGLRVGQNSDPYSDQNVNPDSDVDAWRFLCYSRASCCMPVRRFICVVSASANVSLV